MQWGKSAATLVLNATVRRAHKYESSQLQSLHVALVRVCFGMFWRFQEGVSCRFLTRGASVRQPQGRTEKRSYLSSQLLSRLPAAVASFKVCCTRRYQETYLLRLVLLRTGVGPGCEKTMTYAQFPPLSGSVVLVHNSGPLGGITQEFRRKPLTSNEQSREIRRND